MSIKGNGKADAAAKRALLLNTSRNNLPHSNFKQTLKNHYRKTWQQQWDDQSFNDLYSVKPAEKGSFISCISICLSYTHVFVTKLSLWNTYSSTVLSLITSEIITECLNFK